MTTEKVLIDTDPGIDDAMAVLYALIHPQLELMGLTTIFGNVTTEIATRNALALVEMHESDVPVARGAQTPIHQTPQEVAWEVHGHDGFGRLGPMTPNNEPVPMPAHEFMCSMIRQHPGEITLCPVGPLTNLALALKHDPEIARMVKGVTVMGGSLDEGGNVTPFAEANIWQDPHAASDVFAADWPVTMIGLDVTHRVVSSRAEFAELAAQSPKFGGFLNQAADFYFDFHKKVDRLDGCHMHDPTAVISILHPDWFSIDEIFVDVILDGEQAGRTMRSASPDGSKISVALGVEAVAVKSDFLATIRD